LHALTLQFSTVRTSGRKCCELLPDSWHRFDADPLVSGASNVASLRDAAAGEPQIAIGMQAPVLEKAIA
jgi:hypothetical protein